MENNRIKSALLIIYSPNSNDNDFTACRLHFKDLMLTQVFNLTDEQITTNTDPMSKTIWLVIEEVYKGTKYPDTCLSEIVFAGTCLP